MCQMFCRHGLLVLRRRFHQPIRALRVAPYLTHSKLRLTVVLTARADNSRLTINLAVSPNTTQVVYPLTESPLRCGLSHY
jgi:hypothetical protein